jgi:hypothetical protein
MPWIRIDDKWSNHPKLLTVGPLGKALYMDALCYASQYLTDGFIPGMVADQLCFPFTEFEDAGLLKRRNEPIEWLVNQGLWDEVERGYQIHDYLDFNPSRVTVEQERDAAKSRMRRARGERQERSGEVPSIEERSSREVRANILRTSPEVRDSFAQSSPNPIPIPLVTTEVVTSDAENAREPSKKPDPAKRAHRLPPDWQPAERLDEWAAKLDVPVPDLTAELEKFRDHFRANGKAQIDWDAAWRNWMRRSAEFAPMPRKSSTSTSTPIRSAPARAAPPVLQHGSVPTREQMLAEYRASGQTKET